MSVEPRPGSWVLLSYRMPREPSTPRIAVWRRLRRLGVHQIGDGLVALPADSRTREQFEWLSQDVVESGGTASVWVAEPSTRAQELAMATGMATARAEEYRQITDEAQTLLSAPSAEQSRGLARLRRLWRDVNRRDFFPPGERDQAQAALQALAEPSVDSAATSTGRELGR